MKIAFISDIHSNLHALDEVLANIEELSVDEIYCCGDIVGYNAFPKECLKKIRKKGIKSVLGNHDWGAVKDNTSWFNTYGVAGVEHSRKKLSEDDLKFLQGLPYHREAEFDSVSFYMTHGSPRDNLFEYVFPGSPEGLFESFVDMLDAEVIVLGHTHIPMNIKIKNKIFLNPGSVGQPRDGIPQASFMVFDTYYKTRNWHRVVYNVEAAAEAVRQKGLPSFLADRLFLGR